MLRREPRELQRPPVVHFEPHVVPFRPLEVRFRAVRSGPMVRFKPPAVYSDPPSLLLLLRFALQLSLLHPSPSFLWPCSLLLPEAPTREGRSGELLGEAERRERAELRDRDRGGSGEGGGVEGGGGG
eukprot:2155679-Rhodomonas_salina.1